MSNSEVAIKYFVTYILNHKREKTLPALVFARDIIAFPVACFAGENYKEIEEKARRFLYSTARVVFACGVVWALYKMMHNEGIRNLVVPTGLCAIKLGPVVVPLEPISLLSLFINLYAVKEAFDSVRKAPSWKEGVQIGLIKGATLIGIVTKIWKCIAGIFHQWKSYVPSVFFSVILRRATLKIDPMTLLMTIGALQLPESRLGLSCFLLAHGVNQLYSFNVERWYLREVPTRRAFSGMVHVMMGLGWLMLYQNNNQRLERTQEVKGTYLYRAANWLAPHLAWLVTGGQRA